MPLFDFICKECETRYEDLIRGDEKSACPRCESQQVERQLPVFAVGGESRPEAMANGGCGTCGDPRGPGACAM